MGRFHGSSRNKTIFELFFFGTSYRKPETIQCRLSFGVERMNEWESLVNLPISSHIVFSSTPHPHSHSGVLAS